MTGIKTENKKTIEMTIAADRKFLHDIIEAISQERYDKAINSILEPLNSILDPLKK